MINAILLLLAPQTAWTRIAKSRSGTIMVLLLMLLPLLAGSLWFEGYGLLRWGNPQGDLERTMVVNAQRVREYQLTHAVLLLVTFFAGGGMMKVISNSFHFFPSFQQSFTLVAYGWSPFLWARVLDAHPAVSSWACWLLGAVLAVRSLYHGVALVLQPDQTKGFGLFLVAALLGMMMTGLSLFLAIAVLQGHALR